MKELVTEIRIRASADRVWAILADFPRYPEWNPFVREIHGELRPGARLRVVLQPPGSKAMTFTPRVVHCEPGRGFHWLGTLGFSGVFDGEHIFELEDDGAGGTRLVHREEFRGVLVPWLWGKLEEKTRAGFEAMNEALRSRAEGSTEGAAAIERSAGEESP